MNTVYIKADIGSVLINWWRFLGKYNYRVISPGKLALDTLSSPKTCTLKGIEQ